MSTTSEQKIASRVFMGFIIFIILFVMILAVETVGAGSVRVVTRFGEVTGRVLTPGAHFVIPLAEGTTSYNTKIVTYETSQAEKQKTSEADYKDFPVNTTTKDGQGVGLTYTIRFRIDASKATWLLENIGNEEQIVDKVVKTESRAWVRTIVRNFSSADLYSGNIQLVQDRIFEVLEPKFADKGLILDDVLLREPVFAPAYIEVVEAKQRAVEQVEVEKQITLQEEEKKLQRITQAEAKAEEQRLQSITLDAQVLEKTRLDVEMVMAEALKISAEKGIKIVPNTILGGDNGLLFNLNQ